MRGTGFSLTPYAFVVGAGTGGITYSNQYTVADLYVGGDCGIITPRNSGEFIPLQETALLLKDVICSVGTYSYGSSTCSNCSLGAAFALNGCLPSSSFLSGPTDTAFHLSGAQYEGLSAFPIFPSTVNIGYNLNDLVYPHPSQIYVNGVLHLGPFTTSQECLNLCSSISTCSFWTWNGYEGGNINQGNTGTGNGFCYLFTELASSGIAPTPNIITTCGSIFRPASYSTSPFGIINGSVEIKPGTYLFAVGKYLSPSLPSEGSKPFSVSAWVKCSSLTSWSGVLEWGNNSFSALLAVSSSVFPLSGAVVSTISSSFSRPTGVTVSPTTGMIIVVDSDDSCIHVIDHFGAASNLAGSCGVTQGSSDGIKALASFNHPISATVLPSSGTVAVADTNNNLIRLITIPSGSVSTLTLTGLNSGLSSPHGIASTVSEYLIATDTLNNRVLRISLTGETIVLAGGGFSGYTNGIGESASFSHPKGVAVIPSSGKIVVADSNNNCIRLLSTDIPSSVSTLSGTCGSSPGTSDGSSGIAQFNHPISLAILTESEVIVVADFISSLIRLVDKLGTVKTLVVSGLDRPYGVSVSLGGAILIADSLNKRVIQVSAPLVLAACDSKWHHISIKYEASPKPILSGFLDGVISSKRNGILTLPSLNQSTLKIGWSGSRTVNSGSIFVGQLSDVRIYNRSLSLNEIVVLSQPPASRFRNSVMLPSPTIGQTTYSISCAPGFFGAQNSIDKSVYDGSWSVPSNFNCTPCNPGTFSYSNQSACSPCRPGTFASSGQSVCTPCAAGTFGTNGETSAACSGNVTCPAGFYALPGATTNSVNSLETCFPCPTGTFGSKPGLTSPNCSGTCGNGTVSSSGQITCLCPPGYFNSSSNSYLLECSPCPAGTFNFAATTTSQLTTCKKCRANFFSPFPGSSSCIPCADGMISRPGAAICTDDVNASSIMCTSSNSRSLPSHFGLRLWPASHPSNSGRVDLIVAPEIFCKAHLGIESCVGRTSVNIDGVVRYVIGTASDLNMEPAEDFLCEVH